MIKRSFVAILIVMGAVVLASPPASHLTVYDSPDGEPVGSWSGSMEVLQVKGGWAEVRFSGWVPESQVVQRHPYGIRVAGSPGGGLWVSDAFIRKDDFLGNARITGWITNATGKNFCSLVVDVALLDDAGRVVDAHYFVVKFFYHGETMAFSCSTLTDYGDVQNVKFQYSGELHMDCDL